MKPTLFTLFLLVVSFGFAQTPFWSDTFEDTGAPSSGTRNASSDFSCTAGASVTPTSYFTRTDGTLNLDAGAYASIEGSICWAGEDLDQGAGCTDASQSARQTIIWSGIDITGRTSISFSGLFAANNISAANWDGSDAGVNQDLISVEYSIDGGPWGRLLAFTADATSASSLLRLDTDNDLLGDGAALSYTFTEFTGSVSGIGFLLDLRLSVFSDDVTEEFAVDNFRLSNTAFLPIGLTSFISQCEQGEEVVRWTSESEDHLDFYELEVSYDATKYQTIKKIDATGISDVPLSYAFTIPQPFETLVYYRLKMTDLDGSASYSDIISSKTCSVKDNGLLRSFCVQNGELSCSFNSAQLDYELLTPEGYSVTGKKNTSDKSQLLLASGLNQGIYLLRLSDPQQAETHVYRIFVN
jgi:hypothetical protein